MELKQRYGLHFHKNIVFLIDLQIRTERGLQQILAGISGIVGIIPVISQRQKPDTDIPVVQFLIGQSAVDQEFTAEGLCRGYT